MKAEILCVGTEILLGDIVNTNAADIAKALAGIGVEVYSQSVVGDNPHRLKASIQSAFEHNEIVIMTGGLGPTYDDLTKETVAEYFGLKIELHEPSLADIKCFFHSINHHMTANNEKQAYMPQGAVVFKNDYGTAPGLAVEKDGKIAILMPGPPREMRPMLANSVIPYLAKMSGHVLYSKNLNFFGIGESSLENILKDLMVNTKNPTIAPYAKTGEVMLRVTARAKDEAEAIAMIAPVEKIIRDKVGEYIYGADVKNLESALVAMLKDNNLTLATAESCTGGMIGSRITSVSGSSDVFLCGLCTYSNDMKVKVLGVSARTLDAFGAVSAQTVAEMAQGARKVSGADIALAVSGIAGPTGGTDDKPVGLIYVGIDSDAYSEVVKLELGSRYADSREYNRMYASSHALSMAIKAVKSLRSYGI